MRQLRYLSAFITLFLLTPAAMAAEYEGKRFKSVPEPRATTKLRTALEHWFDRLQVQIKSQENYAEIITNLKNRRAYCHVTPYKTGDQVTFKVTKIIGPAPICESIRLLLGDLAPFPAPPNNLPFQRNIVLEFSNDHQYPIMPNLEIYLVPAPLPPPLSIQTIQQPGAVSDAQFVKPRMPLGVGDSGFRFWWTPANSTKNPWEF